jgi:hypothetical protein
MGRDEKWFIASGYKERETFEVEISNISNIFQHSILNSKVYQGGKSRGS